MGRDGLVIALEHDSGQGSFGLQTQLQQRDVLLRVTKKASQAGDVVGVVLAGAKGELLCQVWKGDVETVAVGDGNVVAEESELLKPITQPAKEQGPVDAVGLGELVGWNLLQRANPSFVLLRASLNASQRHIGEFVVVTKVTDGAGKQRIATKVSLPQRLDQAMELLGCGGIRSG